MFFSHYFWTFNEILSVVFETFPVNLTKLHSTSPKDQFGVITLFWQSFCLCFFSRSSKIEQRINGFFFVKKQSASFSQLLTTCPRRFFEEFLSSFVGHWATFVCHFDKNLSVPFSVLLSVCQLNQFVVENFCSKFFSPINFGHWSQIYQSLFKFFGAKLTTLISTSPNDQFEDLKPFWQFFVCFIYHLGP